MLSVPINVNLCGVDMEDDGINLEKLENAIRTQKNVKSFMLSEFPESILAGRCPLKKEKLSMNSLVSMIS